MANRPIKKYRAGSIEAAVWFNERKLDKNTTVGFKTVSLTRSWKDKEKNIWRSEVINLRKGDLQKVLLVLQKAQEEIFLTDNKGEDE
ncbi:MAG: hypothetical protein ISS82_02975 [Nanoarchaeota archaeon]|nr:hypothetical protein [Nanoarchaeota archaeon]